MNQQALSSFIWSVADLLRGDYKQSEYGKVILPFTVLRRLDCVLEATKPAVLAENEKQLKAGLNPDPFLLCKAKQGFYNTSRCQRRGVRSQYCSLNKNSVRPELVEGLLMSSWWFDKLTTKAARTHNSPAYAGLVRPRRGSCRTCKQVCEATNG